MLSIQCNQQVKIVFGNGCIQQLGEIAELVGGKKALIVCDSGILSTGIVEIVTNSLKSSGVESVIFSDNEPNPPITAVEKGYKIFQSEGCEFIIGVGGGSNIDCAKGINILRFNPEPLIQYANLAKPFEVGSGLIVIPTTSGTGSEMSDGAILSDTNHVKQNFIADRAFVEYAILDPELLTGMPPLLTAYSGLDALTHAIEGYTGTLTNDCIQFYAEKIIDTVVEFLPIAVNEGSNLKARSKMAVASSLSGFLLVCAHTNAGHSIGQSIGGFFDIPHGMACAYAEPWILEFNAPACPELIKKIGKALGGSFNGSESSEEIGIITRDAFINFRDNKCKLPSIKSFKYDENRFDELAIVCANEFFQRFNPRKMSKHDCLEILKKIFA